MVDAPSGEDAIREEAPARRGRRRVTSAIPRTLLDLTLLVVLPAAVIWLVYAWPFVREPGTLPFGADTLGYIWRTDVARTLGLEALAPSVFPPPIQPLGNRPAHPVVTGVIQTVIGVRPLTFAWLSPALFASVAGLAAGVLAADGLDEPRWRAPLYAIGLGGSVFLAWTAVGYATNLMLDGTSLAIVVVVLLMAKQRASWPLAAALLACAGLIHWLFASLFAVILLAFTAVVVAAQAWRSRARQQQPSEADAEMPSWRALVLMLVVGCLLGALILFTVPPEPGVSALPDFSSAAPTASIGVKMQARDSAIVTWLGVPLAALALIAALRTRRRWAAVLLAIWGSLALLGGVAWWILDLPTPPYRWTGFALGLPLLAIAAGPWLSRAFAPRLGTVARYAGTGVAAIVAALLVLGGARFWSVQEPKMTVQRWRQLETVTRYVEDLPGATPISIIVAHSGEPFDAVFAGLPAERLPDVELIPAPTRWYLPENLPAPRPGGVVLALSTFLRQYRPAGAEIGPGVSLVAGPPPAAASPDLTPPVAPPASRFAWSLALALATLWLAGVGWAVLLPIGLAARVAIAPALGMSVMGLVGTVLGRVGVRPSGGGALLILGATMALGVLVALAANVVRGRWAGFGRRGRHAPKRRVAAAERG